uniref:G-protein coupled receptors family 1 profile domain-containing protein n=1 Tax=Chinchilla lanigera TaxID=34839 RepID=A0A8C2UFE0_CHILA
MGGGSQSVVSELVLLGICHSWNTQVLLFMAFLMLYVIFVLGNTVIMILIVADPHSAFPHVFLFSQFVFFHFLWRLHVQDYGAAGGNGLDCFVAICKPLHYSTIMSWKRCTRLVLISWNIDLMHALSHLVVIMNLPFCGFFGDIPLVIKLVCMESYNLENLMNIDCGIVDVTCFVLLLISYTYILLTVHQSSKTCASKVLSTCTARITVVVIFFVPCIFIYVCPLNITWLDKFLAVLYSVFTPLLNPAIYALRNKEMKNAMKRLRNIYMGSHGNT